LITNDDYDIVDDLRRGNQMADAASRLEDGGMRVISAPSATADEMRDALIEFGQLVPEADALFIGLSGRFVHTTSESYYLPSDGDTGPLATLSETALPLSVVLAWLAEKPGQAVLALATDDEDVDTGDLVVPGIGALDIPQGVTVLTGPPRPLTDLIEDHLSQPGEPFVGAAVQDDEIEVSGYANSTLVLVNGRTLPPVTGSDRLADIKDWRAAGAIDTVEAYADYLSAHPDGEFSDMARARIEALADTPEAQAERGEQSLDLSRDARRDIQRDLSLLGFDTRGIDGIFGRGTRSAIAAWQGEEDLETTGYLTREQVALLNEQAARRADELEAEAEARRQEELAADTEYWKQTGAKDDEAGLRTYLKRYPDGEFSELADERLAAIEAGKLDRADEFDRQLWDIARARDDAAAYERYLVDSPNGAFREEAQERIVQLQREADRAEARSIERNMNLSRSTRRAIEARLDALDLRPGEVDGKFDRDTRRALRRYQKARGLPETGFVSDPLMVQLMADTVEQIFR
jgi:peptidoglycan hydrolase-like protein with peptidoglycan-binding domain